MTRNLTGRFVCLLIGCSSFASLGAQQIPHGQDRAPNPPRSPEDAVRRMTVPEGFSVELVASEPEIVNPVAMTFDERGRIWITESVEYPRRSAGHGRDRIKILEDTNGDGRADKFTIFADGLNIPSGIAVGHGGVWVANSPDLLLLRDTDGDDRADSSEVIVTGFGRDDTHELPNSLTWGPDGWLYGLNGVFNPSRIVHCGQEHRFTCALFRVHPRPHTSGPWKGKHAFEVFSEGTSNPWGVAFDKEGSAFVSACVIDHLWHLTETGYYHRQGGPYPPFTWKIDSIVNHKHQKAAYCGLTYFDSDAYPPEYREQLYMGNIHGGCINVDRLERDGSTYLATGRPDFLTANDAWFMPVSQKTGPDGCLYVLDWYDRYHCYQDANRDPEGIDRLKGRLYRIRYQDTPRVAPFDLTLETDAQLIARLSSPNIFFRERAQRLLSERGGGPVVTKLESLVFDEQQTRKARLGALWALIGIGALDESFHRQLLHHADPAFRAWGVRAAGNQRVISEALRDSIVSMFNDASADVRLQLAIAAGKIESVDPLPVLLSVLSNAGDDNLIPRIVWQNLHPLLEHRGAEFVHLIDSSDLHRIDSVANLLPRAMDRMMASAGRDEIAMAGLFRLLMASDETQAARRCLNLLAERIQSGEVADEKLAEMRVYLEPLLKEILDAGDQDHPLFVDSVMVATYWKDPRSMEIARSFLASSDYPDTWRLEALAALITSGDAGVLESANEVLASESNSQQLRRTTLAMLGRLADERVATVILSNYREYDLVLRRAAIETLTQRASLCQSLLQAIENGDVDPQAVSLTQVRKLAAYDNPHIAAGVRKIWGTVRIDRDPRRAEVTDRVRTLLKENLHTADFENGRRLFREKCAVCHQLHGEGETVGPDITDNGRASLEQLLSNVLDPNLVIGNDYQARRVVTHDGRFFTGLLVEENEFRVVLKMQGGQTETIARDNVDEITVSHVSLMPENPEQGMSDQELIDLFAVLASDQPKGQTYRQWIPGVRPAGPRKITDPGRFHEILDVFAPGFAMDAVGEGGLGIVPQHWGRRDVLRTHPVSRQRPCIMRSRFSVPAGKQTRLLLTVSHEAGEGERDWQLIVRANGKTLHDVIVGPRSTVDHWLELSIDLSGFSGETIDLEILNQANDWFWEFAYWDRIQIVTN